LKATLSILHVSQEQLHFAEQKLHFDEIDAAHAIYKPLRHQQTADATSPTRRD